MDSIYIDIYDDKYIYIYSIYIYSTWYLINEYHHFHHQNTQNTHPSSSSNLQVEPFEGFIPRLMHPMAFLEVGKTLCWSMG